MQVTNVLGSSYDITGLTPRVRYNITSVAIGNGIRSDSISISATTLSSGEGTVHAHCLRQRQAGLVVDTQVWCKLGMVDVVIHCTSGCGYCKCISLQQKTKRLLPKLYSETCELELLNRMAMHQSTVQLGNLF